MRLRKLTVACALTALLLSAALPFDLTVRPARAQDKNVGTPAQPPPQRPKRVEEQPARPQPSPQPRPTPSPGQTVEDEEVLSVDTSLVNVLFNAVDKDRRFVTTLRQEDVRVYEDNVQQAISAFQHETSLSLSIAILIDISDSLEVSLPDEKEAALRFVNSVVRPGKDKVAVVSFSGSATVEQDLTDDTAALRRAIELVQIEPKPTHEEVALYDAGERGESVPAYVEQIGLRGSTALWDAVWATATEMMSQTPASTRRAIIVLSDGDDSISRVSREDAVEAAVKAGTTLYSIGFEPFCDDCKLEKSSLRKLSEQTGGRAFFPENLAQLNAAFGQIEHELRTQYLLSYSPTNKARDGSFRRIKLEVVNPDLQKQKLKLTYREGYFALPPQAQSPKRERAPQERLKRPPRRPRKK